MDYNMYTEDSHHAGVLYTFETKKTIIGFRLKVQFLSHHICIFVEAAKHKTVGELFNEICRRFDWRIQQDECMRILVDGKYEVSPEEPVMVLAGVSSVLIDFKQMSRTDGYVLEGCPKSSEQLEKAKGPHSHTRSVAHLLMSLRETSATVSVSRVRMENGRKRSHAELSGSEFNEQPVSESENYPSLVNGNDSIDCDTKSNQTSPTHDTGAVENKEQPEPSDYFPQKKRTRRKRKHSKKNKKSMDSDVVDGFVAPASVPEYPSPVGTGKHTFFKDNEQIEVPASVIREHVIDTVPESRTSCAFYSSHRSGDTVSQTNAENSMTFSDAKDTTVARNRVGKSSVNGVHSSRMDNEPFYDSLIQSRSENGKQLGTLLMYKDMRTSGFYDVEYSPSPAKQEPIDNTDTNSRPYAESDDEICEATNGSELASGFAEKESSDCEVTFQSKIIDGRVHFKCSNLEWRLLTKDALADKQFVEITELAEGQTVVFQLWYLTSDISPSLSELILGRVMDFNAAEKKVLMEIAPSQMQDIISVDEDGEEYLPEGVIRTNRDAFELDWTMVTNPRLLP